MNILITGASGFIGGNLLKRFLADGHNVVALGRKFKTRLNCKNVSYFEEDLTEQNQETLVQQLEGHFPQVIIHVAGQAHVAQTLRNKVLFEQNNVTLTANVLALAKRINIDKFVFFSSVSVLNDDPHDIYAQTKRNAEEMVTTTCRKKGMSFVIVRPVIVYGEGDFKGNMAKMIRQIDRGFFPLFNSGKNIKDILYVQNLVCVISDVVINKQWDNQILLLKDPETLSMKKICITIIKSIGHKCWLLPVSGMIIPLLAFGLTLLQKVGLLANYNVNSVKRLGSDVDFGQEARKEIVLLMPYSSVHGLENTVQWYLANKL